MKHTRLKVIFALFFLLLFLWGASATVEAASADNAPVCDSFSVTKTSRSGTGASNRKVTAIRVNREPDWRLYTRGDRLETTGMSVKVFYDNDTTELITSGFKCSPTVLDTAGVQWITVTYGGTATAFHVNVRPKVTSIRVKNMPYGRTYIVGENFRSAGLTITAHCEDGTSYEVIDGFKCSPYYLNTPGTQWITVTYGGTATALPVKVKPKAASLSVSQMPNQKTYLVGQSLNTSGMKLKVVYQDGTSEIITDGFHCHPSVFRMTGKQTVNVSYAGQKTSFQVYTDRDVTGLSVWKQPDRTIYTVGESLQTDGLILKVTSGYSTDTYYPAQFDRFTFSPTQFTKTGEQTVTVRYFNRTASFKVRVNPKVRSVVIAKLPTKRTYAVSEPLNTSGMKLKVTLSDGTVKEITDGFVCTPSKMTASGQQKIVVSYGGRGTGFYVNVSKQIASVVIRKKPSKLTYRPNEKIDTTGMKLKVTYTDGSSEEVTGGFTCCPAYAERFDQSKIVVTYGDKSTGFYINAD